MRYVALSAILFAIGIGLTQLQADEQAYVPVVRMRTADGHFVTLLASKRLGRSACQQTVDQFAAPLRVCAACSIESMGCTTGLSGIDKALAEGQPLPVYAVVGESGIRVSVVGPPETVKAQCEAIAQHMVRNGMKSAACMYPASRSTQSPSQQL